MRVDIPVSIGELIDKISILEIKVENVTSDEKRLNIEKELSYLRNKSITVGKINHDLVADLRNVNRFIWSIEDRIRRLESENRFDDEFVQLARMIYMCNDMRAHLKKRINIEHESEIVEEKIYR